ncbi:PAS domain S-box protein [Halobaculum sp. D14]|uniref:PAS domain S-box protein n=1 Tax=Halobaculum sp. D14 TaxID=3421642 RepID=UPI003EBF8AD3
MTESPFEQDGIGPVSTATGRGIDVLHVEDHHAFAELTALSLERLNDRLTVTTADSAAAATDVLAGDDVDVDCVVSDYDMANVDGLEFLETVREADPDLPFILFTGKGSEEIASDAISAGVTDYLRKGAGTEQFDLLANRIVNAVDQHRAERTATRVEQRLRELAENTTQVLWMFTGDWSDLLFVNSPYERIYGHSVDDLAADPTSFLDAVHPDDRDAVRDAMARLSAGETADLKYRVNPAESFGRWVWVQAQPIRDADGDVVRIVGFTRDITEWKQQERTLEALHETSRRLMSAESDDDIARIAVDAAHDLLGIPITGCWLYDDDEDVLRPAAFTEQAAVTVGDQPTFRGGDSLAWEAFQSGEHHVYGDVSTVDGRYNRETAIRSEVIVPLGEFGVLNFGSREPDLFDDRDVSLARILAANTEAALVRASRESALRAERVFFDQALNALEDPFYVVGLDGTMHRWNDTFREVTGYTDDEIASMTPADFVVDDDVDRVVEAIADVYDGGTTTVQTTVETKDGRRIPYELSGSVLTDAAGDPAGLVGVGRDVTERRAREERLTRQNERLEQFTRIVSHDVRNPLNVAQGRLELAREERDSDQLAAVADAHDRIETLIDDLLTVAKEGDEVTDLEPVSLADVAAESWGTVDTDRVVEADPNRLQQLLENLFRNAVDHGGPGVTVTVGDRPDGFFVADDGPGIPEEKRDRVFESGYSTAAHGTGFGLSIVRRIADGHGWTVDVASHSDGGARFDISGVSTATDAADATEETD